jgi:hypothetical protein
MPVPTRLANDGWWLCDSPPLAPIDIAPRQIRGNATMTSFAPPIPDVRPAQVNPFLSRFAIALGLAALADWLFYGEKIGISFVIFTVALMGCSMLANPSAWNGRRALLAGAILTVGLIPAIEDLDMLSTLFVLLALGSGVSILTNPDINGLADRARALRELFLIAPFRFTRDAVGALDLPAMKSGLVVWIVPLLMTSIFALLFISANPLLEKWLAWLDLHRAAEHLSIWRILFWVVALSLIWPFIQVYWRRRNVVAPDSPAPAPATIESLSTATVLRSLILFNLLFAVQTVLDAIYLWGNVALPADITYAGYAHRGAYPLIVTALLAACFVLVALRPGGPAERSGVIRPLVYLWVAQNVMLVVSSILRLDLYVKVYLLTSLRVAAFIWMLLVAAGLVLIVMRIALRRSNGWLVRANLVTLAGTLYACSLVNFTAVIADYNVTHSRESSGKGALLDIPYLAMLGPEALPAIDKALQMRPGDGDLVSRRHWLVERQRQDMASWRAWGFRSWRLQRYITAKENQTAPAG